MPPERVPLPCTMCRGMEAGSNGTSITDLRKALYKVTSYALHANYATARRMSLPYRYAAVTMLQAGGTSGEEQKTTAS